MAAGREAVLEVIAAKGPSWAWSCLDMKRAAQEISSCYSHAGSTGSPAPGPAAVLVTRVLEIRA